MEADGVTRVYTTFGGEYSNVKEVFPVDNSGQESIVGYDASSVYLRADARCFRSTFIPQAIERRWLVQDTDSLKFLTIERPVSDKDKEYEWMAKSLEQKLGKTGLTILVVEESP